MSDAHESHWCYRCFKQVAVRTLDDEVLCCECNNGFVSIQAIPADHSNGTEGLHPRRGRNLERVINYLSRRGAPPAVKSAIETLETFEVGSSSSEEAERMAVLCAVCKDDMLKGVIGKKLPCGHCYHENCILPWLEKRNPCPVCRFQLRTDDPHYARKRGREEPPLTGFAGAFSSSSSMSGREENNNHHVVETRRRTTRKTKPNRYVGH